MIYMKFFLGEHKKNLTLLVLFGVIFAVLFVLGEVPAELAGYGFLLCAVFSLLVYGVSYIRFVGEMKALQRVSDELLVTMEHLPKAESGKEYMYQEMVRKLHRAYGEQMQKMYLKEQDTSDYHALWAHQIKIPIAAIRLLAQAGQEEQQGKEMQEILEQVFRIEQYVEMVLNYQRLNSTSGDWILAKYPLDGILRQSIRKYAKQFIRKKLSLRYDGTDMIVLTDEKWLCFVIEQILSNALKYTKNGEIRIYTEGQRLYISDTGIGIQKSDLPRIFEKGYTGYNGRADKKSTGIGLYLCRKVCEKLGHGITVESGIGQGTCVCLELDYKDVTLFS